MCNCILLWVVRVNRVKVMLPKSNKDVSVIRRQKRSGCWTRKEPWGEEAILHLDVEGSRPHVGPLARGRSPYCAAPDPMAFCSASDELFRVSLRMPIRQAC